MTEYNARQLRLMLEKLDLFNAEKLSLRDLIASLDGLLNALETPNDVWRGKFQKQWGVLEDVYANALDKAYPAMPEEYIKLLRRAVAEIRSLVSEMAGEEER